jgi:hypothetical protein
MLVLVFISYNEKLLAVLHFFVGFESRVFVLPKKILFCTNVRLHTSAQKNTITTKQHVMCLFICLLSNG